MLHMYGVEFHSQCSFRHGISLYMKFVFHSPFFFLQCNITARLMESGCSLKTSNKVVLLDFSDSDSSESSGSSGSSGSSESSVECDCDCCLKPHDVCTKYYECLQVLCRSAPHSTLNLNNGIIIIVIITIIFNSRLGKVECYTKR